MFEAIFGVYWAVAVALAIAGKLLGDRNKAAIDGALAWPLLVVAVAVVLVAEGDRGDDRT